LLDVPDAIQEDYPGIPHRFFRKCAPLIRLLYHSEQAMPGQIPIRRQDADNGPDHACILAFHGELRHEQPGMGFRNPCYFKGKSPV
jgi:hypothetical protein